MFLRYLSYYIIFAMAINVMQYIVSSKFGVRNKVSLTLGFTIVSSVVVLCLNTLQGLSCLVPTVVYAISSGCVCYILKEHN